MWSPFGKCPLSSTAYHTSGMSCFSNPSHPVIPDHYFCILIVNLKYEYNSWFSTIFTDFFAQSRCMLHNFGGNIEMYGILDSVSSGPIDARTSYNSTMVSANFVLWSKHFIFMSELKILVICCFNVEVNQSLPPSSLSLLLEFCAPVAEIKPGQRGPWPLFIL